MTRVPFVVLLALVTAVAHAAPADAVAAAVADARTLPAEKARYTRYWDLTHLDAAGRQLWFNVLSWHVNSLSREPEITPPRVVAGGGVLAVDLRDYGIDAAVYAKLNASQSREPYFSVVAEVPVYDGYGKPAGRTEKTAVPAPWLPGGTVYPPAGPVAELEKLTYSRVPVLRGDWFYFATAIQVNRAAGYYDLLGLGKKEADLFKFVGADLQAAKRLKLEMAASVASSGVAINNRGILSVPALTGRIYFTQDYKTSVDRQNTVRLLGGDAEPPQGDASEVFFVLANGGFGYALYNANGDRQDVVPQNIALDHEATGNDRNIHAGTMSCARCHVEGLRPINDYARRLYQRQLQLRSVSFDRLQYLRRLYLSDMPQQVADDNVRYARFVKKCNGLDVGANARAVREAWKQYLDDPVTTAAAARELGCTEQHLAERLKEYAAREPVIDPVVGHFLQSPPETIRREHFEEVFPQFEKIIGGTP